MSETSKVHETVSSHYAKAVKATTKAKDDDASCCGCCSPKTEDLGGVAAKLAGYSDDDLGALPQGAVESSFGCGNPLAFAGVEAGQTVLDLGSGAGLDLIIAGEKVGPKGQVIGIDMTDEMIEKARLNIDASGLENVEIRKGLIEYMPIEASSVDWVISNCVINLSPDKSKVFAEIIRVLRPGGRISISDIVAQSIPDEVKDIDAFYNMCIGGAISETDYIAGLEAAGLTDVTVEDRLVYEVATVKGFLESEIGDEIKVVEQTIGTEAMDAMMNRMEGKVWSAKFTGVKAAE